MTGQRRRRAPGLQLAGIAVLFAALSLPPTPASGQTTGPRTLASLSEGARVRLTAGYGTPGVESYGPMVGTLYSVGADSLTFVSPTSAVTVALRQIVSLELSEGTRNYGLRGLGVGLVVGVVGGAIIGGERASGGFLDSKALRATEGAVLFGAAGALVGAAVGVAKKEEAWHRVAVSGASRRVGVAPVLGAGQTGVGVWLRW